MNKGAARGELVLGHPKGLFFLAFTEMWERFSFYGMRGLLILYMAQELLVSDSINDVAGMDAYRAIIESVFGELSTQAFASQTFGLYSGFVYFTPLIGGVMADRWLGAKKTVIIGIMLMTAGHFAMIFDWSFLLALLLLVLGSGALKGNIAAQVGQLYPKAEEALSTRGFTIFSTGINIGAVLGPLACGLLAQIYGWHYGFGLAGVMMLGAAIIYFAGMPHFADSGPAAREGAAPALSETDWRMIGLIVLVMVLILFQFLAFDQMYNVGILWVSEWVNLATPLGDIPAPWFGSLDALASILIVPLLIALWRWQASQGREPGDLGKMAIGASIMGLSMAFLAIGSATAGSDGRASIIWPVIAFCCSGVSFMWTWPTMLAFVSRHAPQRVNSVMMASAYVTAFVTSIGAGTIARWYEPLGATQFFMLNSVIAFAGTIMLVLFGPVLARRMDALDRSSDSELLDPVAIAE